MVIPPKRSCHEAYSPDRSGWRELSQVPRGQRVRIQGLNGGQRLAGRLAGLGLFPGASLQVLSGGRRGPVIVRSGGSRLGLGRGMAVKILVNGPIGID